LALKKKAIPKRPKGMKVEIIIEAVTASHQP